MTDQAFTEAQEQVFARHGVDAESRMVDIPAVRGLAQVNVAGQGPPVVMVIGGGGPGALWAPLMAKLTGFTLYAVDRPGFGRTDTVPHTTSNLRGLAVSFLRQVLDALGLDGPFFVCNSMGSTWTTWLAVDNPSRVGAMVQIGTPAWILDTSAPLPMRLLSIPSIGRLMMKMQKPSPAQVNQLFAVLGEDLTGLPEIRDLALECEKLPEFSSTWIELLNAGMRLRGTRPQLRMDEDLLRGVSQPVQFIWGDSDPFGAPSVGKRAVRLVSNAHLEVVPGGHLPWPSDPDLVGEIVLRSLRRWAGSEGKTNVDARS